MANLSKVNLSSKKWNEVDVGMIAVGIYEDKSFTSLANIINDSSGKIFTNAIKIGDVKGKNGESHIFYLDDLRILLLGLGKKEDCNSNIIRLAAGKASRVAIEKKNTQVNLYRN